MTDLADNAAALAAGYVRSQTDRGATAIPRYQSQYTKHLVGEAGGSSGGETRATGHSVVSQAAADTQALAALNGQRTLRHGAGATSGTGSHGGARTHDVN